MKNLILIAMLFVSSIAFSQTKTVDIKSPIQCEMCSQNIYDGLSSLKGVKAIKIDLEGQLIEVKYNSKKVDVKKIEESIAKIGYDANDTPAIKEAYSNLPYCCQKPE
ncbi:heavy-metal-associated domain-containing protein [Flavobacteriales bacterium]|nr:heavy-metal-associated domain-containing protein [Flavobacteriales bacterium]